MLETFQTTIHNGLFIDEVVHGVFGAPFAFFVWRKYENVKLLLLFFALLFLMDVDHLVDYWLYTGINFDTVSMVSLDYFEKSGKAIVLFHAWEWVAVLGIAAKLKKFPPVLTTVALAMFAHLLRDIFTMESVIFYSIVFRISRGFRLP